MCNSLLALQNNYFLQDFSDPRDADDARRYYDGRDVDGRRIIVEFAKGVSYSTPFYFLQICGFFFSFQK